jgi:Skp family chaperone for outer membrane proteins
MLKKIFIFSLLTLSSLAFAAGNGIAIVNTDKVKMETKAGQSISQQLAELEKSFKDKVNKMQQDFDSKKQELDKQKAVLSKEAFSKKETDFNTKLVDSRKNLQKEASDLEQMQQVALEEFNGLALSVIGDLAKENQYSQVFPSALMVYADPKSDITSQVIASIDKKIDRIELKAPAAK